ncbi:hypothetical protein [Pseudarthrobacter defluvii]|uniref:hypothetical protein n=1 Tax=Pseudarthrobacter defluvii TaxID=410837 RepID=UPI0027D8C7DF|nr:hypothetical protein [Pseudarthrobacter defluvii]
MNDVNPDLALYVEGESALVAGSPDAIAELFRKLDVPPESTAKVGTAITEMLAAAGGLLSIVGQGAVSGNSFQMTPESYAKYLELAGSTKEAFGIVSGVLRQSDGTIDTVVQLVKSSPAGLPAGPNPAMLAAAVAIRAAIHSLEVQLEAIDVKLDTVLRDTRNEALGNIQGTTYILDKAFGYFEETGELTATLWDQVAGQAAALSQMHAVALNHIDALADGLSAKSFGKRLDGAKSAASGELQHWLIITAVALTNMVRMDSLEIVHGAKAESTGAHARHVERARERRLELTRSKVQKLADAAAKAAKVDALTRVANPFELPKFYDSLSETQRLLMVFSEAYGMPATEALERKEWHTSLLDLGQAAGSAVTGVVGAAAGTVAAAPKAIAHGVEDGILQVAQGIEQRRKSTDPDDSLKS